MQYIIWFAALYTTLYAKLEEVEVREKISSF